MTLREQVWRFSILDIHAAVTMQKAIDIRKTGLTSDKEFMAKNEKVVKAVIEELDQMYDDLDRHMAAIIRNQEFEDQARATEAQAGALRLGNVFKDTPG